MADWKLRSSQRTWEDWFGILLGIVIALAPWVTEETRNEPAVVNAALVGFAVMMLAELDLVAFRRWVEVGQLVCGIWIAASSLIFGYSGEGALRIWHLVAGLLVALLGFLELRQHGEKTNDN
jgi:hypothetical protein